MDSSAKNNGRHCGTFILDIIYNKECALAINFLYDRNRQLTVTKSELITAQPQQRLVSLHYTYLDIKTFYLNLSKYRKLSSILRYTTVFHLYID